MKTASFPSVSSRLAGIVAATMAAITITSALVFGQGGSSVSPRDRGNTQPPKPSSGAAPSASGGTTPSSNNPGSSSVSPKDRPRTNPVTTPTPAPQPVVHPVIVVPQTQYVAPQYIQPVTTVPVVQQTNVQQSPARERAPLPAPPPDAPILMQVIQQKPGMTRYMIVDTQAKTVAILKVRLPENTEEAAEVVLESSATYRR